MRTAVLGHVVICIALFSHIFFGGNKQISPSFSESRGSYHIHSVSLCSETLMIFWKLWQVKNYTPPTYCMQKTSFSRTSKSLFTWLLSAPGLFWSWKVICYLPLLQTFPDDQQLVWMLMKLNCQHRRGPMGRKHAMKDTICNLYAIKASGRRHLP